MHDGSHMQGIDPARRDAADWYLHRLMTPIIRALVARRRAAGLDDEATRRSVLAFTLEEAPPFIADGPDRLRRESFAAWVRQAVDEAIAHPAQGPPAEATRRLPCWCEGEGIELADGSAWSFPVLTPDRIGGAFAGDADPQYPALDADWMGAFASHFRSIHEAGRDGHAPERATRGVFEIGVMLLRLNYQLDDAECEALLPLDVTRPECAAGIALMAPAGDMERLGYAYSESATQEGVKAAGRVVAMSEALLALIGRATEAA